MVSNSVFRINNTSLILGLGMIKLCTREKLSFLITKPVFWWLIFLGYILITALKNTITNLHTKKYYTGFRQNNLMDFFSINKFINTHNALYDLFKQSS